MRSAATPVSHDAASCKCRRSSLQCASAVGHSSVCLAVLSLGLRSLDHHQLTMSRASKSYAELLLIRTLTLFPPGRIPKIIAKTRISNKSKQKFWLSKMDFLPGFTSSQNEGVLLRGRRHTSDARGGGVRLIFANLNAMVPPPPAPLMQFRHQFSSSLHVLAENVAPSGVKHGAHRRLLGCLMRSAAAPVSHDDSLLAPGPPSRLMKSLCVWTYEAPAMLPALPLPVCTATAAPLPLPCLDLRGSSAAARTPVPGVHGYCSAFASAVAAFHTSPMRRRRPFTVGVHHPPMRRPQTHQLPMRRPQVHQLPRRRQQTHQLPMSRWRLMLPYP